MSENLVCDDVARVWAYAAAHHVCQHAIVAVICSIVLGHFVSGRFGWTLHPGSCRLFWWRDEGFASELRWALLTHAHSVFSQWSVGQNCMARSLEIAAFVGFWFFPFSVLCLLMLPCTIDWCKLISQIMLFLPNTFVHSWMLWKPRSQPQTQAKNGEARLKSWRSFLWITN